MTISPLGPRGEASEPGEAPPAPGGNGALMAALFDAIHHVVVLARPDGVLLQANALALGLFGSTLEEKQGQPVWEALAGTLGAEKSHRLRRAMSVAAKGEVVRCKETVTVISGETVHLDVRIRPLYEQGAVAALMLESHDVTEWRQAEQHIRLLYNVISETMPQDDAQIQKALSLTTDLLGMDVGILSRVEGETYTIEACYPTGGALQMGQTFALGTMYCSLTLESEDAVAISHASTSPHRRHPCYQTLGLEAYLGVPVYVAGAVYGTLNFSSTRPKHPAFSAADTDLAKMLSQWIGTALERRAAEQVRRTSEELLSGVLTSSLEGIMAMESIRGGADEIEDFRFLHVNPRAGEILKRTPEDLLGKRMLEELTGVREEGLFDAYVRVIETGAPLRTELRYEHDGVRGWFQLGAVKLGDGFTVTFRDITASKKAEEALRQSEERFRLLAENTTDLICLHELDSPFLYASPSVKRTLGFEPDEPIGASPYDIIHPENDTHVRSEIHEPTIRG
ncbi:MAG: PAS domain S-box protein, partial [Rhodothermales bacterium]